MAQPFETDNRIAVAATLEEVWQAITTGPGVDSWFMGRNEVEPRVGGTARTVLPGFTMESTVTAWEPPNRFSHRTDEGEDGTLHAFEWQIEDRGEGTTDVRWIHNGFLGGEWEAEYDALKEGDPAMLFKLGQFLTYFRGRTATSIDAFGPSVAGRDPGWTVFREPLGLTGSEAIDGTVRLTPEGLEPIEGVVDYLSPNIFGLRSEDGLYRFIRGFQDTVVVGHHIFTAVDETTQEAWGSWLTRTFG